MGARLFQPTRHDVAKAELGTKRVDPETGKKFYDLNKDPIVSPYTGTSYPRSFFESVPARARSAAKAAPEEAEEEVAETAEFISLEEADSEAAGGAKVADDDATDDDDDVAIEEDDGDVFIEEEEEEGDDVADIIGDVDDEEP
jgi:uncharacterized protein (TIGR02300 family)